MTAPAPILVRGETEFPDQFLASFGKDAAIGCFTADSPRSLPRHTPVLLKTPRGLETGHILGPATIRQARLVGAHVHGDLVRVLNFDDDDTLDKMSSLAQDVLDTAQRLAEESDIPVSLLDAEVFFDLGHALLHVLHPNPDDLAPFVKDLSDSLGLDIRLANLAVPIPAAEEDPGCGKPNCGEGDCGSGEGGCSTGGCSTGCGTGGQAVDLKPYFAHLREQMETTGRVPLV